MDKKKIAITDSINPGGGQRQVSTLPDENAFPLTYEEFQTINDHIKQDSFSNLEAFLLSSGISFLFASISIFISTNFYNLEGGKEKIDILKIIILCLNFIISLASLLSFFIIKYFYKKNYMAGTLKRLLNKIEKTYEENEHE